MLFFGFLVIFAISSLVTSSLAYDGRRWIYAATVTTCSAVVLIWQSAKFLQAIAGFLSFELHLAIAAVFASAPYLYVLFDLWHRRCHTPRHTPSLDDDPVLRRHVEEKIRRGRLRRQAEEQEEMRDDVGFP